MKFAEGLWVKHWGRGLGSGAGVGAGMGNSRRTLGEKSAGVGMVLATCCLSVGTN